MQFVTVRQLIDTKIPNGILINTDCIKSLQEILTQKKGEAFSQFSTQYLIPKISEYSMQFFDLFKF